MLRFFVGKSKVTTIWKLINKYGYISWMVLYKVKWFIFPLDIQVSCIGKTQFKIGPLWGKYFLDTTKMIESKLYVLLDIFAGM